LRSAVGEGGGRRAGQPGELGDGPELLQLGGEVRVVPRGGLRVGRAAGPLVLGQPVDQPGEDLIPVGRRRRGPGDSAASAARARTAAPATSSPASRSNGRNRTGSRGWIQTTTSSQSGPSR